MGLMDEAFKSKEEKSKEAYGRGVKDADDVSIPFHVGHAIGDLLIPPGGKESQSYEAGYHALNRPDVLRRWSLTAPTHWE